MVTMSFSGSRGEERGCCDLVLGLEAIDVHVVRRGEERGEKGRRVGDLRVGSFALENHCCGL